MKIPYEEVSPEAQDQILNQGFIMGLPKKAGWYLAVARSHDEHEAYSVLQLWYNPMATPKWWAGGGYVSNHAEAYRWENGIRAYKSVPKIIL